MRGSSGLLRKNQRVPDHEGEDKPHRALPRCRCQDPLSLGLAELGALANGWCLCWMWILGQVGGRGGQFSVLILKGKDAPELRTALHPFQSAAILQSPIILTTALCRGWGGEGVRSIAIPILQMRTPMPREMK